MTLAQARSRANHRRCTNPQAPPRLAVGSRSRSMGRSCGASWCDATDHGALRITNKYLFPVDWIDCTVRLTSYAQLGGVAAFVVQVPFGAGVWRDGRQ